MELETQVIVTPNSIVIYIRLYNRPVFFGRVLNIIITSRIPECIKRLFTVIDMMKVHIENFNEQYFMKISVPTFNL